MAKFVTGYQYGANKQYIGEYEIPAYDEIDLVPPPNTTLVAPPAIPNGKEAIWGGKKWKLQNKAEDLSSGA